MAEYIERKAFIRYVEKQEVIIKDGTSVADVMRIQGNVFRRCVETAPAADVIEVVRCKECRFYEANSCFNRQWDLESSTEVPMVSENDFCSYGERKEQK